jgi:hypothetical protein
MPIPNADFVLVPLEKLTDYLLNEQHPVGGSKAKWFRGLGYDHANPAGLEQDLRRVVSASDDFIKKDSPFGVKYVVSGIMATPNGQTVTVTTVWIVEPMEIRPRLVTAYPGEKS